jgi:hypothetical protein
MPNIWSLDLNIELQKTITQGAFLYRRCATNSVGDFS